MRVLLVVPRFHTNLAFAVRALMDHGIQVALATSAGGRPEGLGLPQPRVLDPAATGLGRAMRLLREQRPDLVVVRKVPGLSRPFHLAALLQGRATLGYDQRPVLRPRRLDQRLHGLTKGQPWRRISPVHGLPGAGRADPAAMYLPFPVPALDRPPAPRAPAEPARILCVGKLAEARKQQFLLAEAAERLAPRHDFRLTFAGSTRLDIGNPDPGHLDRLRAYAATGPLADRVRLVEDLPFAQMGALYAGHDICVLPSRGEPLGTAPLEAMGQGAAAVVSSDTGTAGYVALARAAGHGVGAVFESGDAGALAAALEPLLASAGVREAARRAAWAWAADELSPELFVQRFRAAAAWAGVTPSRG